MSNVKNTRISALLPFSLVKELKKISEGENITQSSIIKDALEFWLQQRLKKDTKFLAGLEFDDLPNENDWGLMQPEYEN